MEKRSREKIIPLEVYTDGSLKRLGVQTSFGGWAYYIIQDGHELFHDCGSVATTTNQRMELRAILEGLRYAQSIRKYNEKVIVYSDSAYAINCYNQEWYRKWITNGWRNGRNQPVANQDLWLEIIPYFDSFWYDFRKVEGHRGVLWNEKCDELAQREAEKLKFNWRG